MGHLGDSLLTWISEVLPPASLAPTTLFPSPLRLLAGLPELRSLEVLPLSVGYRGRGSYATKSQASLHDTVFHRITDQVGSGSKF